MNKLSAKRANVVYDILVARAGAREDSRDEFVRYLTEDCRWGHEYRFIGSLGMGGKLHHNHGSLNISCYHEDETDERREIIETVNGLLETLEKNWKQIS